MEVTDVEGCLLAAFGFMIGGRVAVFLVGNERNEKLSY
jgi:hypothetical protein